MLPSWFVLNEAAIEFFYTQNLFWYDGKAPAFEKMKWILQSRETHCGSKTFFGDRNGLGVCYFERSEHETVYFGYFKETLLKKGRALFLFKN